MSGILNERQRRLYLAAEAQVLGYGGISLVSRATNISRPVIHAGLKELTGLDLSNELEDGRIRRRGGGRKRTVLVDDILLSDLEALLEPVTIGDPQSPLRWTTKSTRSVANELKDKGHQTSHSMLADLLHELDYSLQSNRKNLEGTQHADRNAQFEFIASRAKSLLDQGEPVISVDAKKKELVGSFANSAKTWRPRGDPEEVLVHDFIDPSLGRANPYGIYDIGRNEGWVSVGVDHDTASFAIESIARWWRKMGSLAYPTATKVMITADGGGSNASRVRLRKLELQKVSNEIGIPITVCHLPPGTSKWNKIEHRMFSYITMNWRGRPLVSHEVIINSIANTKTTTGPKINAELDTNSYPLGVKVSDEQLRQVNIDRADFHGEWNYTISPQNQSP
ncbi:MAG: ISAzo13 family transposase [Ferrimicrobium sp.]